ncbi:uncharacterized protein [Miscanthus floridulus]|uniref:uncharacterized protein n=1 Tax=Miscanthus floridulus TaxID=154761 RepID=UPI0034590684
MECLWAEALDPGDSAATPLAQPPPPPSAQTPPPPSPSEPNPLSSTTPATPSLPEVPPSPCPVQPDVVPPRAAFKSAAQAPAGRPGHRFQELLLRDFYSTAAPLLLGVPLPKPGTLWLTPSFSSAPTTLNSNQVSNILSFCLTSPPVVLKARSIRPFLFHVLVASENVARFIALRGHLRLGSMEVDVHGDEARAAAAADRLAGPAFNAPQRSPTVTLSHPVASLAKSGGQSIHARAAQNASSRRPYLLKLCTPGSPSLPPLLPLPMHATSGGAADNGDPCIYRANNLALCGAPRPVQPASFLQAVLKPPQPTPVTAPRRFRASPNACYRCLAVDHHVKDCRDPVRCRRCGGYGHMVRNCRTPRSARLHWAVKRSPRNPGSPPPASHGVARPVPVVLHVPSRPASPPPSSSVLQSPTVDPINRVASSSANPPAPQLPPTAPPPREPASAPDTPLPRFGPVRPPARDLPCPFGNLRLVPGFPGFDSFFYGLVRPFPLAPLPRLPVILPSTVLEPWDPVPSTPLCSYSLLALPWHDVDNTMPAPPPSPAVQHLQPRRGRRPVGRPSPSGAPEASSGLPVAPDRLPQPRRSRGPAGRQPQRASSRLAARESGSFVDMTTKAVNRKALRESLVLCSSELKAQVSACRILKKKNPLMALDLSRLAKAACLDGPSRRAVAVAAATGRYP